MITQQQILAEQELALIAHAERVERHEGRESRWIDLQAMIFDMASARNRKDHSNEV